ncbi:MAG: ABC-type transport auxiliary lipoprotein family protein [Gemmatimonadota bacterium]
MRPVYLALLAGVTCLCACGSLIGKRSDVPERRKFIIEAAPLRITVPRSARPYPYRLEVREFAVSRMYERDQIVFRLSPEEIREDRWHVWAVRPGQMITDAIEQYLRDARLFTDIRQEFLDTNPDYSFSGTVNAIERFDSGDQWYARLTLTMQVMDQQNQIVWRHTFGEQAEQVYNPDFGHTVETMKQLLRRYMEEAIPEIDLQVHVRMLQAQNQPYEDLLVAAPAEAATVADTTAGGSMPGAHPHYEILPGKVAPDAE